MTTAVQDDESAETVASGEVASRVESILKALQQSHDDKASRSTRKARTSRKTGLHPQHQRCRHGNVCVYAMRTGRRVMICDGRYKWFVRNCVMDRETSDMA